MSSGVNHASGPCLRGHFILFFLGLYAKLHFFPPQGRRPFAHSGLWARGEGWGMLTPSLWRSWLSTKGNDLKEGLLRRETWQLPSFSSNHSTLRCSDWIKWGTDCSATLGVSTVLSQSVPPRPQKWGERRGVSEVNWHPAILKKTKQKQVLWRQVDSWIWQSSLTYLVSSS